MSQSEELEKFFVDFSQEIINKSLMEEEEEFRENIFTEVFFEYLYESGEIDDGNISYHTARGIKVNGFGISEDETELTLFVCIYKNEKELFSVAPSEVTTMLKRCKQFYIKSCDKYFFDIEEAYNAYDISKSIYDLQKKLQNVKIVLLTNGTVKATTLEIEEESDVIFSYAIWDIERLYRVATSGNARETIELHIADIGSDKLVCTKVAIPEKKKEDKDGNIKVSGGYTSYITVFPGRILYSIYEKYGSRLLEKNVRAFLQVRGGVNKGIKNTILDMPEMFLAYNNGISATAEKLEIEIDENGQYVITDIKDFQIVNGGQTTASIYNSCIKNLNLLDEIFVQAKITVVEQQDRMDKVVPMISRCANTQNKVQMADFSANDEFHIGVENLSRTVWAPAKSGGEQQTKWFYERARGQYADVRSHEKNSKYFDSIYPKVNYFDKLELARFENVWDQLPHITSRGGQASFRDFTLRLQKRGKLVPDQSYYENLIAKAILYRQVKVIVRKQNFLGFWANIADYTVAYLSYLSAQRISLKKIWKDQRISTSLALEAEKMSQLVYNYIIESSNGQNTQQWCKKEACWNGLREKEYKVSEEFKNEWISKGKQALSTVSQSLATPVGIENELIQDITKVNADTWYYITSWAKETSNLQGYQRSITFSLGKLYLRGIAPSYKQARQALLILKEANNKGVSIDVDVNMLWDKYNQLLQ